jgi:Gluconate 2-dehydrogenase subunit 3
MLATAVRRVNRGKKKNLCCPCERLSVSGTIGAKSNRRRIAMETISVLKVVSEAVAADGHLTRREMVRRLVAGTTVGAAWPLVAASHPIHELLRNDAILDEAEKLEASDWKPLFLSAQQSESLAAIAESIVPGSTRAQVNQFIDLLLSVDTEGHKKEFVVALAAFEGEAQKRFAKNFPALDESQKNQLLTDASATPAKKSSDGAEAANKRANLHEHFENLKGWVSIAYYSSEIGMKELGWTPDRVFARFPGCDHPEGYH